ncbi:uncharacterized protein EAE98_011263 [Botrytis deweyae]|uniref:Uncharacterized protein n=1 Tax=Botrytis deweyae TaxID=2478750 RepID=A0ABQ7I6B4_9HELO|nr:uncharacterized protein EAE98_011263 [Botrytis deweyae]KAF7915178.1 hypothetical protein EAE98_011263 [Botrytis deweyae]
MPTYRVARVEWVRLDMIELDALTFLFRFFMQVNVSHSFINKESQEIVEFWQCPGERPYTSWIDSDGDMDSEQWTVDMIDGDMDSEQWTVDMTVEVYTEKSEERRRDYELG